MTIWTLERGTVEEEQFLILGSLEGRAFSMARLIYRMHLMNVIVFLFYRNSDA